MRRQTFRLIDLIVPVSTDLDEIDLKILNALKKNARVSFRKIASDLGVSPMTVIKRETGAVVGEVGL